MPGAARREPQDLVAHAATAAGLGQRLRRSRRPSAATRRVGRPTTASHSGARSALTMAAVATVLASTHEPAATVAVRHGLTAGLPVAGSTRWWRWTPSWVHRRTVVLEVASAPLVIRTTSPGPSAGAPLSSAIEDRPARHRSRAGGGDVAAQAHQDARAGRPGGRPPRRDPPPGPCRPIPGPARCRAGGSPGEPCPGSRSPASPGRPPGAARAGRLVPPGWRSPRRTPARASPGPRSDRPPRRSGGPPGGPPRAPRPVAG